MNHRVLVLLLAAFSVAANLVALRWCGGAHQVAPRDEELAAVLVEGRALAERDAAAVAHLPCSAWPIVPFEAVHPSTGSLGRRAYLREAGDRAANLRWRELWSACEVEGWLGHGTVVRGANGGAVTIQAGGCPEGGPGRIIR